MTSKSKTVTMGVKLDENTRERLKNLGRKMERTPHWLMKRAIMEFLEREEISENEKREAIEHWYWKKNLDPRAET